MSLEPPSNSVVDTLRLAPICVNAFVGVALVTIEALRACNVESQYIVRLSNSGFQAQKPVIKMQEGLLLVREGQSSRSLRRGLTYAFSRS